MGHSLNRHLEVGDLVYNVEDPTEVGFVIKIDPIFHLLVDFLSNTHGRRYDIPAYMLKRV